MNFGLEKYNQQMAYGGAEMPSTYKPRSLREQLTDRIASHQAQIDNLNAALAALTPDVERALDALQKL